MGACLKQFDSLYISTNTCDESVDLTAVTDGVLAFCLQTICYFSSVHVFDNVLRLISNNYLNPNPIVNTILSSFCFFVTLRILP